MNVDLSNVRIVKQLPELKESRTTLSTEKDEKMMQSLCSNSQIQFKELPTFIVVETRCVTMEQAVHAGILVTPVQILGSEVKDEECNVMINLNTIYEPIVIPPPPSTVDAGVSAVPVTKEAGVVTDGQNPTRDRNIQVSLDHKTFNTVATQCDIDFDCEFEALNSSLSETRSPVAKQDFVEFAKEKTIYHKNGKHECLVCGEVKVNFDLMCKHMSLHYGPEVLCAICGNQFEHVYLYDKHACLIKKSKKKSVTKKLNYKKYKCPHFRCAVTTISLLELYDHINEHTGTRSYTCVGCKRCYHTVGELRRHFSMRLKCLEKAKVRDLHGISNSKKERKYRVRVFPIYTARNKRVLIKVFLSRLPQSNFCQLCLKHCTNSYMYFKHLQRCKKAYKYRMQRKLTTASGNINKEVETIVL